MLTEPTLLKRQFHGHFSLFANAPCVSLPIPKLSVKNSFQRVLILSREESWQISFLHLLTFMKHAREHFRSPYRLAAQIDGYSALCSGAGWARNFYHQFLCKEASKEKLGILLNRYLKVSKTRVDYNWFLKQNLTILSFQLESK